MRSDEEIKSVVDRIMGDMPIIQGPTGALLAVIIELLMDIRQSLNTLKGQYT